MPCRPSVGRSRTVQTCFAAALDAAECHHSAVFAYDGSTCKCAVDDCASRITLGINSTWSVYQPRREDFTFTVHVDSTVGLVVAIDSTIVAQVGRTMSDLPVTLSSDTANAFHICSVEHDVPLTGERTAFSSSSVLTIGAMILPGSGTDDAQFDVQYTSLPAEPPRRVLSVLETLCGQIKQEVQLQSQLLWCKPSQMKSCGCIQIEYTATTAEQTLELVDSPPAAFENGFETAVRAMVATALAGAVRAFAVVIDSVKLSTRASPASDRKWHQWHRSRVSCGVSGRGGRRVGFLDVQPRSVNPHPGCTVDSESISQSTSRHWQPRS